MGAVDAGGVLAEGPMVAVEASPSTAVLAAKSQDGEWDETGIHR